MSATVTHWNAVVVPTTNEGRPVIQLSLGLGYDQAICVNLNPPTAVDLAYRTAVARPPSAPVQRDRAFDLLVRRMLDDGLDRREAGA